MRILFLLYFLSNTFFVFAFFYENEGSIKKQNRYIIISGTKLFTLTSLNPNIIFRKDFNRFNMDIGLKYVDDIIFDQGGTNLSRQRGLNKLGFIFGGGYSLINTRKFLINFEFELNLINKRGFAFSENLYQDPINATHLFLGLQPGLEVNYKLGSKFRIRDFIGYGVILKSVFSNYNTKVNLVGAFNLGLGISYKI